MRRPADEPLDAVGIGVPSIVRFETGEIAASTNIPLKGVPLRQVLGDRLGVPVFVDNDATVAALAEAHDENLKLVSRNLVMITVGHRHRRRDRDRRPHLPRRQRRCRGAWA